MVEEKEGKTNVRFEMKGISSPYALENIPILIAPQLQKQWYTNTKSLWSQSNSSVGEVVIRSFSQPPYTFPTKVFFSVPVPFFESTISIKPRTILPSYPDTSFHHPKHLKRPLYLALWLPQVHFTPRPSDGVMMESKFRATWAEDQSVCGCSLSCGFFRRIPDRKAAVSYRRLPTTHTPTPTRPAYALISLLHGR